MADVKISALPASTTPLAGTEVLPIVQSSTTKQVSVANLTAGRAVSASSLTLTTPLSVANGGTGLTSLTAGYIPYGNGTGALASSGNFYYDGANVVTANASVTRYRLLNGTDTADLAYAGSNLYLSNGSASGVLLLQTANTERMRIASDGSVGIGTSSPKANLDLTGSSLPYMNISYSGVGSMQIGVGTGGASVISSTSGPILFKYGSTYTGSPYSSGTTLATLDTAGNLGLGVTPSAWGNTKTLQIGVGSFSAYSNNAQTWVTSNAYYDGSSWRYNTTAPAVWYAAQGIAGAHVWYNAASGSAGSAISFTQAMTLTAAGDLGLGVTSPLGKLHVNSSAAAGILIGYNNTSVNYFDANTHYFRDGSFAEVMKIANGDVNVSSATATPAGGSTAARLIFGTTAGFGIYYGSGAPTVAAAQGSIYLRSDGSSTSTRLYVNTNGSTTWTNVTTAA